MTRLGRPSTDIDAGAPANAPIKKENPEITDALLAYGRGKMKEYGVVDGDAKQSGIGVMTDAP